MSLTTCQNNRDGSVFYTICCSLWYHKVMKHISWLILFNCLAVSILVVMFSRTWDADPKWRLVVGGMGKILHQYFKKWLARWDALVMLDIPTKNRCCVRVGPVFNLLFDGPWLMCSRCNVRWRFPYTTYNHRKHTTQIHHLDTCENT